MRLRCLLAPAVAVALVGCAKGAGLVASDVDGSTTATVTATITSSASVFITRVEDPVDYGQGFIASPAPAGTSAAIDPQEALDRALGEVPSGGVGTVSDVELALGIVTSTESGHSEPGGEPIPLFSGLASVVTFHGYCPPSNVGMFGTRRPRSAMPTGT